MCYNFWVLSIRQKKNKKNKNFKKIKKIFFGEKVNDKQERFSKIFWIYGNRPLG